MGIICTAGAAFQTYFEDGKCVSGFWWTGKLRKKMYLAFAVNTFCTYYAVPCACFFSFYGSVAYSMHKRKSQSDFGSSRYSG